MFRAMTSGLLSLAVLGWVVVHCGPRETEVVVHVMEPDVELTVGDQTYQIEGRRYEPIVSELSPGWYPLIMSRGDRILYEESFEVRRGDNIVLTAWDAERLRRDQASTKTGALARPLSQGPSQRIIRAAG
jgi:hypothetical protein